MKTALGYLKVGFLGTGNMGQAMIRGLLESGLLKPSQIWASNRLAGKLQKLADTYKINVAPTNDLLLEKSDVIILAVKPQDLRAAVEPLRASLTKDHIVISLAAGISLGQLATWLRDARLVRVMPNTPTLIRRGILGYCANSTDQGLYAVVEDLLSPLGYVVQVDEGDEFEALAVSCASGTGFVFELMQYWQEWMEEHGLETETARKLTVETFLGAAMLANQTPDQSLGDLLSKVTSKKGMTAAGLDSMRELEIERALRYSFEKAALRSRELGKEAERTLS